MLLLIGAIKIRTEISSSSILIGSTLKGSFSSCCGNEMFSSVEPDIRIPPRIIANAATAAKTKIFGFTIVVFHLITILNVKDQKR